jgi:putative oxidoreductase
MSQRFDQPELFAMTSLDIAVPLIARILLVILFPFSALDKILDWNGALKQANSSFLPGGPVLLILAIIVEIAAPVCIVLAWYDRIAAFVLAGFCVITALVYHEFWKYGDFWAPGESQGRNHFWDFLKNLGLVGGLLMVVFGTRLAPLSEVVADPLSSTPVYSAAPARSAGQ